MRVSVCRNRNCAASSQRHEKNVRPTFTRQTWQRFLRFLSEETASGAAANAETEGDDEVSDGSGLRYVCDDIIRGRCLCDVCRLRALCIRVHRHECELLRRRC